MVGDPAVPSSDTGFEVVRKGYDQAQVEAHLRRLDAGVRILTADRDAALDQSAQLTRELDDSRARADRLRAQVRTLVSPPQSVQGMSERMRSMLRLAEDEVSEMLMRAETEVNKRVRDAEQRAAQIVTEARSEADAVLATARADAAAAAQESEQVRAELEAERKAGVEANTLADDEAAQERSRIWAESEARRALVEEDFTIAMNQRRKEALADLTAEQIDTRRQTEELRASAAAEARNTIDEAQVRAKQIVADAERRIVELTGLRNRIVDQLGSTRAVLERSLGDLGPLPEERPAADSRGAAQPVAAPAEAPVATPAASPVDAAPATEPDAAQSAEPAADEPDAETPDVETPDAEAPASGADTDQTDTEGAQNGTPRAATNRRRTRRPSTAVRR
jgi:hypothetical protein